MNDTQTAARDIYAEADRAGKLALMACVPDPMIVTPVDLRGCMIGPSDFIPDGVCGFAWVSIRPASPSGRTDCPFVAWLRKNGIGRYDSYEKAWSIWVNHGNQSMTKKEAYAEAFASVLTAYGISAYAGSRMD